MANNLDKLDMTTDFRLRVSQGAVAGVGEAHKFGFNADVGSGAIETVWDVGGRYAYPASATVMKISSSDAADTSAGTGARTVTVYGLDADGAEQNETVTLNGQAAVNTTGTYLRVFRMIVNTAGSTGWNEGIIYCGTGTVTAGVPATKYAAISIGENQTLMAMYTIPAGKKFYLQWVDTSSFGNSNVVVTVRLCARPNGEVFQTKDKFLVTRGQVQLRHELFDEFDALTDIELTAISSGADVDVSGSFEGYLVDVS